jgi:hypothetical protein
MKLLTILSSSLLVAAGCGSTSSRQPSNKNAEPPAAPAKKPAGDCCCSYNESGESAYITMVTATCLAKPSDNRPPTCVEASMCGP